jgi:hypothetical protein
MPITRPPDFSLRALYDALDARRAERGLTWAAVGREVNRHRTFMRPIAVSTISGLRTKTVGEGDGILQMLLWLERTPESFVPGIPDADDERFQLPALVRGQILRWDARRLFTELNVRRAERSLTWTDVAREIGLGYTPGMLTRMAKGGRLGFPHVMRLVGWLDRPAVDFTRISIW